MPDFLDPLEHAMCLVRDINLQRMQKSDFGFTLSEEQCNTSADLAQSQRIDNERSKGQSHAGSIEIVAEEFVSWPCM